jgi:type II secretory pathway pseudopilin PulG
MPEGESEGKSGLPVWLWVILGCGGLLAVVFVVAIVAAIAIPSLLAARRSSLETNAVGSCRAYCGAQVMYKRNDWEPDGVYDYAVPYTRLYSETDATGEPIQLIDPSFAAAQGPTGAPKQGYLYQDLQTIAGQKIDPVNDYALCGIPAQYGRTGRHTMIVTTNATVFGGDQGPGGTFLTDYPDPTTLAGSWIVME